MASKKERRKQKTELARELGLPNPSTYRDYSFDNIKRLGEGKKPVYDARAKKSGNIPSRPIIRNTVKIRNKRHAWQLMSSNIASIPREVQKYLLRVRGLVPEGSEWAYAFRRYVHNMSHERALERVRTIHEGQGIDIDFSPI